MTFVELLDVVKVSISAEFKSILLVICIDAGSTTNSRSFGLRIDGAGTYFPKVRRMMLHFFSFNFMIFLDNFHTASRSHRSCHSVSSWDRSSNFGALGSRWWGSPGQIIPSEGFWSRMLACDVRRLLWIEHIGLTSVCLSSSAKSMKTSAAPYPEIRNPQLSCNFQHSHCTFDTILLRPVAGLFINLAVCIRALSPKPASIFGLVEQAFWRMPFFTEWIGASSFEVILARQSKHSSTGLLPFGLLVPGAFFTFCCVEELGDELDCVDFARLLISCRKLQLSPFELCPSAFHYQQSPRILCPLNSVPYFFSP